jgi:hypothetical protein
MSDMISELTGCEKELCVHELMITRRSEVVENIFPARL